MITNFQNINSYNGAPVQKPTNKLLYNGQYNHYPKPVIGKNTVPLTLKAYLIDSANPDLETVLDSSYSSGLDFGLTYATDRKREIIFILNPLLDVASSHFYTFYLKVKATATSVNKGSEPAEITTDLTFINLDDASEKWATLPVTWNNRPDDWVTFGYVEYQPAFGQVMVHDEAGGGKITGSEYPFPTSLVFGEFSTYAENFSYEFSPPITPQGDEKNGWFMYFGPQVDIPQYSLPELGFALKWSVSNRFYTPYEDSNGNPVQINDQYLDINCKFYGYEFYIDPVVSDSTKNLSEY
jgi:hypothetical protein